MAIRTLSFEVVSRFVICVAGKAVPTLGVIKGSILPVAGVMAVRTLSFEVTGGFIFKMTCLTIGGTHSGMIEGSGGPGKGIMAGFALAAIMICWLVV